MSISDPKSAAALGDPAERQRRLYAALSASNEAILKARDPSDLFQKVCDASIHISGFKGAAVLVPTADRTGLLHVAATDRDGNTPDVTKIPPVPVGSGTEAVRGMSGEAFVTGRPTYTNDYLNEPRLAHPKLAFLRAIGVAHGINAAVGIPVMRDGTAVAVFTFYLQDKDAVDEDMLALLQRIADNLAFALDKFDREEQTRRADRINKRLSHIYAALSATNEALLKARDEEEMFRLVCAAVAATGRSFGAAIFTVSADGHRLDYRAYAGDYGDTVRLMQLSLLPGTPFSEGLHGPALRERRIQYSSDVANDPRTAPWVAPGDRIPHKGCAVAPLTRGGEPAGVMFFFGGIPKPGAPAMEEQLLELMDRIAQNVSFKLGALAAETSRVEAERRTSRLNEMFVSLSRINEAIIHAGTPRQMFESVCATAADGGTTLGAAVLLHERDERVLVHEASAGRLAELMRTFRIPTDPTVAGGRGQLAKSFMEGKPVFVADMEKDSRRMPFRELALRHGIRAVAGLPLLQGGEAVGLFVFLLGQGGNLDAETQSLMQRTVDNVSFALDNFAKDSARERVGRMFAALSATNEAIMHAESREDLFRMTTEAVVSSGNFSSVTIVSARPETRDLTIAATTGPAREHILRHRYSWSDDHPNGRGLIGKAMRSGTLAYSNDYLSESSFAPFRQTMTNSGQRSGACVPLTCRGEMAGALLLMSYERNTFNREYLDLIEKFGQNISFALGNFARAEERKAADERIKYLATHDEMTGLPNRATFSHLLNAAIRTSSRNERQMAVLFIDLDRFKVINDTLGHESGDLLLVETGKRITGCLRSDDVVARLGGDEFVVILNEVRGRDGVAHVARNLMSAIGRPISLSGHECRVNASIGIAMYPEHGADEQTLTKRADMAMYQAKEEGKNDFRFFSETAKTQSVERLMMEANLRHALERDEFSMHYQPKVDLATGQISGVEALLRWNHPDLGTVSPAQFIPLAEETGLIVPIGRWVLHEACRQNMEWQKAGLGPVRMAVNVSPRQFSHETLLKDIDEALAGSGMPAELLQIEVTESMVMQNVDRAIALLDQIKKRGAFLAIDDFGTGYSSMALLRRFPVDTLKIDRSFIKDLPGDVEDMAITQAIISMAKALDLTVVAEGVETEAQKTFLDHQACDEMQGFLFSRPLTPEAMAKMLAEQPPAAPLQPEQTPRERRRIPERRLAGQKAARVRPASTVH